MHGQHDACMCRRRAASSPPLATVSWAGSGGAPGCGAISRARRSTGHRGDRRRLAQRLAPGRRLRAERRHNARSFPVYESRLVDGRGSRAASPRSVQKLLAFDHEDDPCGSAGCLRICRYAGFDGGSPGILECLPEFAGLGAGRNLWRPLARASRQIIRRGLRRVHHRSFWRFRVRRLL